MPPQLPARINVLRQLLLNTPAIFEHQLIIKSAPTQLQNRRPHMINWRRNFSQSSPLLKKKPSVAPETAHPFDFSILEAGIATAVDRLKAELSKLGTGGRFNPGVLENLRVPLVKDSKATERLGDLAQVLPKGGRSIMLLVGEKEHMKSIVSAIQGSKDLNLQPVPDPNNSSQLNISLPPPTKESRDLAVAAAKKAGEAASLGVKNARAAMQKRLRAMELSKAALPDDLRKAHKDMEKIVERGTADVKQTVEAARKAMEKS